LWLQVLNEVTAKISLICLSNCAELFPTELFDLITYQHMPRMLQPQVLNEVTAKSIYGLHPAELFAMQGHSSFKASSIFFSLALFFNHPVWCMPSKMLNGLRVTFPS
jgi:hypothetical protein